jgi:hypothetical protein
VAADWLPVAVDHEPLELLTFEARATPELWDLKEIAWKVTVGTNGRVKGFQPPKDE